QETVDDSLLLQTELAEDASVRIDDRRDAGVGRAHHWQTLLDGAKLCLMKMLIRTSARAEPRIVGDVQEPAGSLRIVGDLVGKNDLVANERPRRRRARDREQARTGAGTEAAADAGELQEAETLHEILKRKIFAERHEMDLVVAAEDLTLVADHDETVVDALGSKTSVGVALGDCSRRSHEQARALRQHIADFVKRLRGVGEEQGNRRLRPDHERAVEPLSARAGFGEIEIGVENLGAVLRAP